jgi:hypothetical protein
MSTKENANAILAEKIVEAIMPSKSSTHRPPITRIALKSGRWPTDEKDQGGLNRDALREVVLQALQS